MEKFGMNQRVRVRVENPGPNERVPEYIKGRVGLVVGVHGEVANYEHDHADPWGPLYSVLFEGTSPTEKVIVDLHEPWLESVS